MEWIVEGVAFVSVAAFVGAVASIRPASLLSYAICAVAVATLIALALVSLFTGFRIDFLPFRLCPVVLGSAAALIAWGAWL